MSEDLVHTWIHGISGKLGSLIATLIQQKIKRFRLIGGSYRSHMTIGDQQLPYAESKDLSAVMDREHIALIFDFSSADANLLLLDAVESSNRPMFIILGSTGLKPAVVARWQKWSTASQGRRVLWAPNTSLGIMALAQTTQLLRRYLADFDIEISETHHRDKIDQPSGTALYLAQSIAKASTKHLEIISDRNQKRRTGELGIHSLRGGSVFGDHTVHFFGTHEEISLSHRAYSRELFAAGACKLSLWLLQQPPGFFGLEDVDFTRLSSI